jgi:hypothetical protein
VAVSYWHAADWHPGKAGRRVQVATLRCACGVMGAGREWYQKTTEIKQEPSCIMLGDPLSKVSARWQQQMVCGSLW